MGLLERLAELPLEAHAYYLREYYLRGGALWDGAAPARLRFLEGRAPGRALDVGCGTGRNAIALAEAGWSVVGLDVSARAIARARASAPRLEWVLGPATALDGGPYDLVLDVLGPASDLAPERLPRYADAVARALAREGLFAVLSYATPEALAPLFARFRLDRAAMMRLPAEPIGRWWLLGRADTPPRPAE